MGETQFQKQKYIYKFDVNQWKLPNLLHWIYQTFRYFGAVFDSLGIENTIRGGFGFQCQTGFTFKSSLL